MFTGQEVTELAARKQLVLAQSQAHRLLIQLEAQQLRATLSGWQQPAGAIGQAGRRYGWVLAAASGLLLSGRGASWLRWGLRGVAAWKLVKKLLKWD